MTEYEIGYHDGYADGIGQREYIYGTDGHEGHWLTGEEIVRCRYCSKWHANDANDDGSMRGTCDEWTHLDGFSHATHEGCFCSWGKRRDAK